MSNIEYEFFMSQITHIRDIKENQKTKISMVFYEGMQAPCILKVCKGRDLSGVYEALAEVKHPNVATIYDYIYAAGNTYVIEEFVAGKTLQEMLEEKGRFSEKDTAKIIMNVCCGLEHFHNHKPAIVHNDIKTSNIMVREDGSVKLMDFDISRVYKEGASKNTKLFGTEEYAAPEHYGFGQSEPSTDIYTLGVTMHEMLTGSGLTNDRRMTYKGKLSKIIGKCIEVDRSRRYQNAYELKGDLEKFLDKKSVRLSKVLLLVFCAGLVLVLMGNLLLEKGIPMLVDTINEEKDDNVVANNQQVQGNAEKFENASGQEIADTQGETTGLGEQSAQIESKEQDNQSIQETEEQNGAAVKKMRAVYQVQGELKSLVALENGTFVILEQLGNKCYIIASDETVVELEDIRGKYGEKLIYNQYDKKLYLLQFEGNSTYVYQLDEEYQVEQVAILPGCHDHDNSHISCSFFSDGTMLINAMFKFIDTTNWLVLGDSPVPCYVINDKMYKHDSNMFYEVDSSENVLQEYPMLNNVRTTCSWEEIYVNGFYAYFIGREAGKDYVYRFDGENYETVICLNDYRGFTSFDYNYLCVTEGAVWCYDEELGVIKEFALE